MSVANPSITAANIITDVEERLGNPNLSSDVYLPWISYAHTKTYAALMNAGQEIKERLFGTYLQVTLTKGVATYTLSTILPRFESFIRAEILYGATGDQRAVIGKLRSPANWANMGNVSTSYQPKDVPLYYLLKNLIGFIPTPPASDAADPILYAWYILGPYQINASSDVMDVPYRFLYPIVNYVQARAIEKQNEDYSQASLIEQKFEREIEQVAIAASSEVSEHEGDAIEVDAGSMVYDNPFGV